jgi:hypothetical protein
MPNDWRKSVRRQRSSVKTFEPNCSAGAAKFDAQAQAPDVIRDTPMHTYLDEGHGNFMWRATGDLGGSILFVHVPYLTYCSAKSQLETLSRHPRDLSIYAHDTCNTLNLKVRLNYSGP